MFVEAIYHNTFIPKLSRDAILKNLSVTRNFMNNHGIYGCTLVFHDEVLHLFQGRKDAMLELKKEMHSTFRDFHISEVSFERVENPQLASWDLFTNTCDNVEMMFPKNVVDQSIFEEKYITGTKNFPAFRYIAGAILEREPILFQSAS